jgi:hypothetical protein
MSPSNKLVGVRAKIERAKEHIADLERAINAFDTSKQHTTCTKVDPQTGQIIFYLASMTPIPPKIALIAGDALHNLRSALDYLVVQFYTTGKFRSGMSNITKIRFPIFRTSDSYETKFAGEIEGSDKCVENAIRATKPYKGGNNDLWALHELDIIDKHRMLLTAACYNRMVGVNTPLDETGGILHRRGFITVAA